MQLPGPVRAVVGLVAVAADEAKHFPDRAVELPMLALSSALQVSLRAQQRYARLTARGDEVLNRRAPSDEPPPWAHFDEPVPAAGPAGGPTNDLDEALAGDIDGAAAGGVDDTLAGDTLAGDTLAGDIDAPAAGGIDAADARPSAAGPSAAGPSATEAGELLDDLFGGTEDAIADPTDAAAAGRSPRKASPRKAAPRKATSRGRPRGRARSAGTDPGTAAPGTADAGTAAPDTADPGTAAPGTADAGTADPGTAAPGTADAGTADPGTADSGTDATDGGAAPKGTKAVNAPRHIPPSAFDTADE